jgi:UDP-2,4-diacetamido-2,4,6-trideoxy-beta-L-altropyranose hydrolase
MSAINQAVITLKGKTLLIHANAGSKIGIGHVMRCLALAQEWIRCGGQVEFIGCIEDTGLREKIKNSGSILTFLRAETTQEDILDAILKRITSVNQGSWIIIDSYSFSSETQKKLKDKFSRVLLVDDYHHQPEYHATLILNQNCGAQEIPYKANRDCTVLAGTDYVMLRNEFRTNVSKNDNHEGYRILVTLGGSDADNITQIVLEALESLQHDDLTVTAVLGPANRNKVEIDKFSGKAKQPFIVLQNVSNMAELISSSDLIISAGGSTCWEICALEKPMAVIVTAENQQRLTSVLAKNGAAINMGNAADIHINIIAETISTLLNSAEKRNSLARSAHKLVDGNGVIRIVNIMSEGLILRNATKEDCAMILDWVNDPDTRKWSYNRNPITLEEHKKWFAACLAEPESIYLIAEDGLSTPVGQIRFQKIENGYEVHVLVAKQFRGGGTGSKLIRKASLFLHEKKGRQNIMARAKSDNIASVKAFEKAGYRITAEQEICGAPSVIMEFDKFPD